MNTKHLFFAAFIIIFGLFISYKFTSESSPKTSPTNFLTIGTCADYAPFTFVRDGEIVGFDIDVIQEVSKRLNLPLVIKNISFDVLLLELQRGTLAVVAAGLCPTEQRAQKIFFTITYLENDPLIALTKTNALIQKPEGLIGKKVLVNEGYTADMLLSGINGIELERIETVAQGFLSLSCDKADAFVLAKSVYGPYAKTDTAQHFIEHVLEGTAESCALGISKKYPELLEKINATLVTMIDDGTIETLKKKWLS